jgi:hypothetical protein
MKRSSPVQTVAYLFRRFFRSPSSMSGSPQRGFEPICSGILVTFVTAVVSLPRFIWHLFSPSSEGIPSNPCGTRSCPKFFYNHLFTWLCFCLSPTLFGLIMLRWNSPLWKAKHSVWGVQQSELLLEVKRPTVRIFMRYLREAVGMKAWRDCHVCLSVRLGPSSEPLKRFKR